MDGSPPPGMPEVFEDACVGIGTFVLALLAEGIPAVKVYPNESKTGYIIEELGAVE